MNPHDPTTILEAPHEHPEYLAHGSIRSAAVRLGQARIWLFLTTEILMFSGLFCGYAVLRALHPKIFLYAHHYLSVRGALNTVVLIFSSFTMAWGVRAAELGQTKLLVRLLAITLACACIFLGVKWVKYKRVGRGPPARQTTISRKTAAGRHHAGSEEEKERPAEKTAEEVGQAGGCEAASGERTCRRGWRTIDDCRRGNRPHRSFAALA